MATKASLLSEINGFLTAVITIANHRLSMSAVVDEIYPSAVTDNSTDETYTTQNTASITYAIQITKQGRSVRINGSYTNTSASALPAGTEIYAQKDNQYKGSTSEFIGEAVVYTPYKLSSRGVIPPSSTTKFFITYNANE